MFKLNKFLISSTFAERVQAATNAARAKAAPFMPSRSELELEFQVIVDSLQKLSLEEAYAYTISSFTNNGHESHVIRMYKGLNENTKVESVIQVAIDYSV